MSTIKELESQYEFFHNPIKGVCVAKIDDYALVEYLLNEVTRIQNKMQKRGFSLNLNGVATKAIENCFPNESLIARARCDFNSGDEYSFEIGEVLSGHRLTSKIIALISDVVGAVEDEISSVVDFLDDEYWKSVHRYECAEERIDNIWENYDI